MAKETTTLLNCRDDINDIDYFIYEAITLIIDEFYTQLFVLY